MDNQMQTNDSEEAVEMIEVGEGKKVISGKASCDEGDEGARYSYYVVSTVLSKHPNKGECKKWLEENGHADKRIIRGKEMHLHATQVTKVSIG